MQSHELDAVFMESGKVDFVEVGLAARGVLRREDGHAQAIRHLLVDEFQDTSRTQHEFWPRFFAAGAPIRSAERPRTLFLVGDPMQSIYMFRQADVELFELVRESWLPRNLSRSGKTTQARDELSLQCGLGRTP